MNNQEETGNDSMTLANAIYERVRDAIDPRVEVLPGIRLTVIVLANPRHFDLWDKMVEYRERVADSDPSGIEEGEHNASNSP